MIKQNYIQSTLDPTGSAILEKVIPVKDLVLGYQRQFNLSIQKYFEDIENIELYQCQHTSYRFFYPLNIEGDGDFYKLLQEFDWYYMPWKWEHEFTKNKLKGHEKVLEVGCGGLGFIENLSKAGYDITGLELNEKSVEKAKIAYLKVLKETIQEHSLMNFEKYDVVCSFQVLEHISEVNSFVQAQCDCLRKGGKLIIAVPNNDSFIKYIEGGLLNFPPHHMGWWNKKSLFALTKIFALKVEKVVYEPLQDYHFDWYVTATFQKTINKFGFLNFFLKRTLVKQFYKTLVKQYQHKIKGHTMIVIFSKI